MELSGAECLVRDKKDSDLRAVTIANFRCIVTDSFDEPKVNHNGDLKSVT